jgi:two-component system cell cycle response regulator DivK
MASEKGAPVVLVIEDNASSLELVTDVLTLAGYVVIQARAAAPGIELARRQRPQLVLMDLSLPGMDGLAATRALKQDPLTCHIPVLALTAHAMKGDEERARNAGADAYLTKPIDIGRLTEAVRRLIVHAGEPLAGV